MPKPILDGFVTAEDQLVMDRVRMELANESERGCALVAAAFIDDSLEQVLYSVFRKESVAKKSSKELFAPNMALSSTYAKARLCHALGVIIDPVFRDIDAVRHIRNTFAHQFENLTFEHQAIRDRVESLHTLTLITEDDLTPVSTFTSRKTRWKFMQVSSFVNGYLNAALRSEWTLAVTIRLPSASGTDSKPSAE